MKKIIRLTESELTQLIGVIVEQKKRFENQERIDAILDKISEFGMDSLTDDEKDLLKNPEQKIEYVELEPTEEKEDDIITMLLHMGLIDEQSLQQKDDNLFIVTDIPDQEGYSFRYFENGNVLQLVTKPQDEELLIEFDPEAELNDVEELREFIEEMWGEAKEYIEIHFLYE